MTCILTYPDSLRLLRAARCDADFTIDEIASPFQACLGQRDTPVSEMAGGTLYCRAALPERESFLNAAMMANPGEPHALPPGAKLHVLVSSSSERSHRTLYCYSVLPSGLPMNGSFVSISRPGFATVMAESPALCVVRGAKQLLSVVRKGEYTRDVALFYLVKLVGELCGRYARSPDAPREEAISYDVDPVLTVAELGRFCSEASRIPGRSLAQRVANLLVDGLGSPMEVVLELLLCAPPHLGGLGLEKPVSNQPLAFDERQRTLVSHGRMRPDLYWERWNLAVEYNGHIHDDPAAKDEDDRRVADYQALGIRVFPARFADVRNPAALDVWLRQVVHAAAQIEGRRWERRVVAHIDSRSYQQARALMLAKLLPGKRNGC